MGSLRFSFWNLHEVGTLCLHRLESQTCFFWCKAPGEELQDRYKAVAVLHIKTHPKINMETKTIPDAQCMVYLPTFTIQINQSCR